MTAILQSSSGQQYKHTCSTLVLQYLRTSIGVSGAATSAGEVGGIIIGALVVILLAVLIVVLAIVILRRWKPKVSRIRFAFVIVHVCRV